MIKSKGFAQLPTVTRHSEGLLIILSINSQAGVHYLPFTGHWEVLHVQHCPAFKHKRCGCLWLKYFKEKRWSLNWTPENILANTKKMAGNCRTPRDWWEFLIRGIQLHPPLSRRLRLRSHTLNFFNFPPLLSSKLHVPLTSTLQNKGQDPDMKCTNSYV